MTFINLHNDLKEKLQKKDIYFDDINFVLTILMQIKKI